MEEEYLCFSTNNSSNNNNSQNQLTITPNNLVFNRKQGLESEDSSYDSDCEVSDGAAHYDVSRTVSDTLGQEFDEYITSAAAGGISHTHETGFNHMKSLEELTSSFSQTQLDDSLYQSRVDFARKLGYTEEQFDIALSKLGPSPSQNELLAELIQLDCSSSSPGATSLESVPISETDESTPKVLRHIVIDGSNVAMSHGNNKIFSCRGIRIAVDYFKNRNHKDITVFIPSYRKESPKPNDPISDQEILLELEKEGLLVFTPSRIVGNKRLVCYDDRYILKLAADTHGIVVSNDNYRDLLIESPEFKKVIQERMLMYSFVNDRFMPPEDPLGRNGPSLSQFLSKTPLKSAPPCPYGRKCTYGAKCKYFHPTIKPSVSENLRKQAALKSTQSLPLASNRQAPISRTRSAVPLLDSSSNSHKKLQRQLSINPVNDPRIGTQNSKSIFSSHSNSFLSPFPNQPGLSEVWCSPVSEPENYDEERRRIYFHLAAIFPKHKVTHVMNLYPEERDPQAICREIIRIYNS